MYVIELIAERKIKEAMDDGAFDHLEGAGRPLPLEENTFEDPSVRMAHRLLKNNGFAPAWIEESKAIDRECAELENEFHRHHGASRIADRTAELNRRIERFNLTVPLRDKQKRLIRLIDERKGSASR